jgi:hypothetical protein
VVGNRTDHLTNWNIIGTVVKYLSIISEETTDNEQQMPENNRCRKVSNVSET